PHRRQRPARGQPGPAGGAVRHHDAGLALRHGRHDALPGQERTAVFSRRFPPPGRRRLMVEHFYPEKDLGTPAVESATLVSLNIDGVEVTVPEGTSVMRAAALVDINIPKLCATDSLESFGSCRLCTVEIEGRRGFHASCTTPVAEGMVVRSQSQALA